MGRRDALPVEVFPFGPKHLAVAHGSHGHVSQGKKERPGTAAIALWPAYLEDFVRKEPAEATRRKANFQAAAPLLQQIKCSASACLKDFVFAISC